MVSRSIIKSRSMRSGSNTSNSVTIRRNKKVQFNAKTTIISIKLLTKLFLMCHSLLSSFYSHNKLFIEVKGHLTIHKNPIFISPYIFAQSPQKALHFNSPPNQKRKKRRREIFMYGYYPLDNVPKNKFVQKNLQFE